MLCLERYNQLETYINSNVRHLDRYTGNSGVLHGTYDGHYYGDYWIESVPIGYPMLPLCYNGYDYDHSTKCIDEDNINDTLEAINNINFINNDEIAIIKLYTRDVDRVFNSLSRDLYKDTPSVVCDLYDKCIQQAAARDDDANQDPHIKIKISKVGHTVIVVSDIFDYRQRSDYFLTLGLIPVLFKDVAEKLNEIELKYFEALVRRSQLKRISNTEVEALYDELLLLDKYHDQIKDIKFKNFMSTMLNVRIRGAEELKSSAERSAANCLRDYTQYKTTYYQALAELERLKGSEEETKENLLEAIAVEGIADYDVINDCTLEEIIVTPLIFYSEDDAEIVINNIREPFLKKLFTKLFINQEYKMYVNTKYTFSYDTRSNFSKPNSNCYIEKYNALFNPHIYFYHCLGNYEPTLRDLFAKKDLLMFNNTAIASTKSINFADGAVMNKWKEFLLNEYTNYGLENSTYLNIKALEDKDGNRLSIRDIMEGETLDDEEATN